jgi:hypothetical protein
LTRPVAGLCVVLGAVAAATAPLAIAQDPPKADPPKKTCRCTGTAHRSFIDVSKDPSEVEPPNKLHVRINPFRNAEGQLMIDVLGKGVYPNETVMILALRHRKVPDHFAKARVVDRGLNFGHRFGPFTRTIPGGGIVAEVWFLYSAQSKELQDKLVNEHFFFNTPPCPHDLTTFRAVGFSTGGCDAEDEAEKLEKGKINEAFTGILDAWKSAQGTIAKVATKEKQVEDATKALETLKGDLEANRTRFNDWSQTREFLLFPRRVAQLRLLTDKVLEASQAQASTAGASVSGVSPDKAGAVLTAATNELTRVSEEVKGFIDEKGSLDKQWDAFEASVKKGSPGADAAKPPSDPGKPTGN